MLTRDTLEMEHIFTFTAIGLELAARMQDTFIYGNTRRDRCYQLGIVQEDESRVPIAAGTHYHGALADRYYE